MKEQCPDCGGFFEPSDAAAHKYLGASPGCWAAFNVVMAREFQDAAYFAAHRFTVDAYTAQHPGDPADRRAVQSANIHLAALFLIVEKGRPQNVPALLSALATGHKDKFKPLAEPQPFSITVNDIVAAEDAAAHCERARDWAEDVWRANAVNQDRARELAAIAGMEG
ncbi:MAG: DUF5946 family protein [Pseudomonadota bacterium]